MENQETLFQAGYTVITRIRHDPVLLLEALGSPRWHPRCGRVHYRDMADWCSLVLCLGCNWRVAVLIVLGAAHVTHQSLRR